MLIFRIGYFLHIFLGLRTSKVNCNEECYNIETSKRFKDDLKTSCSPSSTIEYYLCDFNNSYKKLDSFYEHDLSLTNEKRLLILLDRINATLYGYKCVNKTSFKTEFRNNKPYKIINQSCENMICFLTSNPNSLISEGPRCDPCVDTSLLITQWVPFMIMGFLCVLGNGVVIFQKITFFKKLSQQNKEIQMYSALVLSLAVADELMGIYLVGISIELQRKGMRSDIYFSDYHLCDALGVISLISSQVSLSMIIMISFLRLYGVVRPYKRLRLRFVLFVIAFSWLIWITVALTPVINVEPLTSMFNIGFRNSQQRFSKSTFFFADYSQIFGEIAKRNFHNKSLQHVFREISTYSRTNTVIEKAIRSFNMLDIQRSAWTPVGHYNSQYYCSLNLIVNEFFSVSNVFTLLIVIFNLTSCLAVIIAYIKIYFIVANCKDKLFCYPNNRKVSNVNEGVPKNSKRRKDENQKLLCTITMIVATDVTFWFFMCVISLANWEKYNLTSRDSFQLYLKIYTKFQSYMFCFVPLNSVLNPFIYLFHFWKSLFENLKNHFRNYCQRC